MEDSSTGLFGQELSYWKAHVSVQDVLSCELSYSLIYDNIHPDKVPDALATVGLTVLPNRFFLIQVDDYLNYANKLRVTQEFFQKTALIYILREYLKTVNLQGFVANLVGLDKVICFLSCDTREGRDANEYLLSIAEDFKRNVRDKSPYTVSICISERCTRLIQYSKMYPRMDLALSKSYFSGKEFSILLEDVANAAEAEAAPDLNECYPALLTAIIRHNAEQFEQVLQKIMKSLLDAQTRPQRVRLELVRLLQRVEEYCIRCGVPKGRVLAYSETAANRILSSNFIADIRTHFRAYYEQVASALEEYGTGAEYSFQLPVAEYIAEHYHEPLRLGDLAQLLGFSEGHFARMFRKKFGMTFVQYLTGCRIRQSKRLLAETNIPIEQIAYRVGMNSYSYFCTCFKRACGLSPGAYRNRMLSQRKNG